jgi:hypothetical protein
MHCTRATTLYCTPVTMWCTTGVKIGGGGESKHHDGDEGKDSESKAPDSDEQEAPQRTVEVKIVSGTHGHLVSILKVQVCPRPFVLNRTLRFQVIKLPTLPVIRVTPATYRFGLPRSSGALAAVSHGSCKSIVGTRELHYEAPHSDRGPRKHGPVSWRVPGGQQVRALRGGRPACAGHLQLRAAHGHRDSGWRGSQQRPERSAVPRGGGLGAQRALQWHGRARSTDSLPLRALPEYGHVLSADLQRSLSEPTTRGKSPKRIPCYFGTRAPNDDK